MTWTYSHGPAALGAKVIATASTAEKLDICTRYGKADHAINYSKPGWQQQVLKLTGGKGVGKAP
jgi:NADPH2:quinone reductase